MGVTNIVDDALNSMEMSHEDVSRDSGSLHFAFVYTAHAFIVFNEVLIAIWCGFMGFYGLLLSQHLQ